MSFYFSHYCKCSIDYNFGWERIPWERIPWSIFLGARTSRPHLQNRRLACFEKRYLNDLEHNKGEKWKTNAITTRSRIRIPWRTDNLSDINYVFYFSRYCKCSINYNFGWERIPWERERLVHISQTGVSPVLKKGI